MEEPLRFPDEGNEAPMLSEPVLWKCGACGCNNQPWRKWCTWCYKWKPYGDPKARHSKRARYKWPRGAPWNEEDDHEKGTAKTTSKDPDPAVAEGNALEQERQCLKTLLEKGGGTQKNHYEKRIAEIEEAQKAKREVKVAAKTPAQRLKDLDETTKQTKKALDKAYAEVEDLEKQEASIKERLAKAKADKEESERKHEEAQAKYKKKVEAMEEAEAPKAQDPTDIATITLFMEGLVKACPALQQASNDLLEKAKVQVAELERAKQEAEEIAKANAESNEPADSMAVDGGKDAGTEIDYDKLSEQLGAWTSIGTTVSKDKLRELVAECGGGPAKKQKKDF